MPYFRIEATIRIMARPEVYEGETLQDAKDKFLEGQGIDIGDAEDGVGEDGYGVEVIWDDIEDVSKDWEDEEED